MYYRECAPYVLENATRECAPYVQENVPLSSLCNGFAPYVLENMPLVFIYLGFNLGFFIYVEGLSKKGVPECFFH